MDWLPWVARIHAPLHAAHGTEARWRDWLLHELADVACDVLGTDGTLRERGHGRPPTGRWELVDAPLDASTLAAAPVRGR